jgi:sugar (pentulose or hexulose) kinase
VRACSPLKPDSTRVAVYDEYYPLWQNLYRSLKEDFAALAKAHE